MDQFKKSSFWFWVLVTVWVAVQLYLVVDNWNLSNHDDALAYQLLAQECLDKGCLYPSLHNLYDQYVFAPGYINLLMGVHYLFGTFSAVMVLNLLLNIVLLWEVFILAGRLFDRKVAFVASVLYMLTYSNVYLPIAQLTDLPFTFLLVTALLFSMNKKLLYIIMAGILIALANWIRPLAVVFVLCILVYFFVYKRGLRYYAALLLPLVLTVLTIGFDTHSRTGHFTYQSTTGGVNLAMSSFDAATGLVNFKGFYDTSNYIYISPETKYTYPQRDSCLKAGAKRWILENPLQYIAQVPFKVVALYCEDTWPERVKPNMGFATVYPKVKDNKVALAQLCATVFVKSLTYYLVIFFFLYYLWGSRRELFRTQNMFLLIPLLGTAMTVAVVVTSRYHYPFLFMMTIYAAKGMTYFIKQKQLL